jgi:DNA-binding SARP family transcriptional activator
MPDRDAVRQGGVALEVRLLGPPEVLVDGRPLRVDTRKAVALLAYLAVTGTPHSRDVLATLLWPGDEPDRARGSLRRTLSTLRSGLADRWIRADREWVSFEADDNVFVDLDHVSRRLHEIEQHGHPAREVCTRCVPILNDAASLHRGDFLAGFSLRDSPDWDDWQSAQAEMHRRSVGGILERLAIGQAAAGMYRQAIDAAERWLSLDPLDEAAHRQLMLLNAWAGDRASALDQYLKAVRILDEELGVPPLSETTELNDAILEDDIPPAPSAGRRVTVAPAPPRPPVENPVIPLVGRESVLAVLTSSMVPGAVLAIEGEAGIGKTRLLEELARGNDGLVFVGAYQGEAGLAYGLIHEVIDIALRTGGEERLAAVSPDALSQAARLFSDLAPGSPPADDTDATAARTRLFDGVARTISTLCAGKALVIDDVHWADEASIELLSYLTRRLDRLGMTLVVTWRTEELPPGHGLRRVVSAAHRHGDGVLVRLDRLDAAAVGHLAAAVLGDDVDPGVVDVVFAETEGLPFFVVEYLTSMQEGRPGSVEVPDILESRLTGLSDIARQVASAAAVIGRSFDLEALRSVCGRSDDEVVAAIEELLQHGVVREPAGGATGYNFSHELLRRHVLGSTSLARRRLLHQRTAAVLSARHRRDPRGMAAQIGFHLEAAGNDQEAADHYALAAERAATLYANREALDLYHRSLALGNQNPAALHTAIGDLEALAGTYGSAVSSYQTALAIGGPSAQIERRLALVHSYLGAWEVAEAHVRQAQGQLTEDDPEQVTVAIEHALIAHRSGDDERAATLAEAALEAADAAGNPSDRARANNLLGILRRSREPEKALDHLMTARELAVEAGDPRLLAGVLNNLALVYLADGEVENGIEAAEEALDVYQRTGDRHREAAVHNNLADLLHRAGRGDEAMAHLKEAVAIFADVGTDPGAFEPAVWKLAEL